MKFKAENFEIRHSLKGAVEITFKAAPEYFSAVRKMATDKDLDGLLFVEVKKYRKSRTLDQNALLWAVENKISDAMKLKVDDVHRQNVIDYGVRLGEAIKLAELAEKWAKTNYAKVLAEKTEKGVKMAKIALYKGSSDMDTKEFARLVDGVFAEAENLGLDIEYESRELRQLKGEN